MGHCVFRYLRASRSKWWLVVITGALTLIHGSAGVWQYDHVHAMGRIDPLVGALGSLYNAMQMLMLHTPHFDQGSNLWIEAGSWCGAFTLLGTTSMRSRNSGRISASGGWRSRRRNPAGYLV